MMKKKRKQVGQSLVEFALLLPILLLILAGVLDLGRMFYSYVAVTDAAAEGASYAAIYPNDTTGILDRVQSASGGLVVIDRSLVSVSCPSCPTIATGDRITVTVVYSYTLATPFISAIVPGGALMLNAVSSESILATR
jgi:Flp pilus assembly protein TadG